jgi:TRAP transporter 4TM/12TM fusion protein
MDVMGNLLMGFIVFSVVLEKTGGGEFFINLGFALLGHRRGGPAKVAVISSGFFGSISGSPLLNVAVTGSVTIPAMKKLGYDAVYAGAVEACASTASVLMPPVMGATAFLICQVIGVPYTTVILAAAVPAVLYFVALLIKVDLYAAHHGLVGLPKDQIPSLIGTLKGGWPYIFALLFLVYQLIVLRTVTSAPYYSSLALIIAYLVKTRGKIKTIPIKAIILGCGSAISSMIVVLLGVGIIIGALTCTGVAYSFTNEVIMLAGDKPILLMALGAVVAFFLGMGLTISAVYIFLAMTLAPPLVAAGFDKLAVHLFIMYCGMLSEITPPVCLAAYTAAGISGANHFKTGITSMRLGLILYVLPFVFLNNPALILKGSPLQIIQIIITFIIGIIFLVSGTENHLWGLGSLAKKKWLRLLCLATGSLFLIATTLTDLIGLFFGLFVFLIVCWFRKRDRINASRNIL